MFRSLIIAITFLHAIVNSPSLASTITVKKGDTLSKIAKIYKVSLRELMDINNIYDAGKIKVGQRIKVPDKTKRIDKSIYIVKKGDTIFSISKKNNIPKERILDLNNISDPNNLYPGTRIFLDYKEAKKEDLNQDKFNDDEIKVTADKKIKVDEWRDYDVIKVNWSQWKNLNGNHVAPSIHKNGKPLFIALNCQSRRINATGGNGEWREWFAPNQKFEHDLLNEVCKN